MLFTKVPIPSKGSFITEENFLVKIGICGHYVLSSFTERATHLIVVWFQFLHELDFVSSQTKILPRTKGRL